MIHVLNETPSLITHFLSQIRDKSIQKDSMRFRRNLERVGEIFAYEISKTLKFSNENIETSLGIANADILSDNVILGTILRAGLPMHQGLLNYFDSAENAFVSAYRKYDENGEFIIKIEYISSPSPKGKILILTDPMLATGHSMLMACRELLNKGMPAHIHIVTLIASREGLNYLQKNLDMQNITIWTAAIDNELTAKSYIVPGLGDAGDLAYGQKE